MAEDGCSRRTLLGAGGAGVFGIGLLSIAGCSSSHSGSGGAATSASASAGTPIAKLSDVPVGGSVSSDTKVDGHPVVVSQKTAGAVTAFSAVCTHMGCTVNAAGAQFHCPCHGSIYDAFTGQVVQGPAPSALTAIPVKVAGDEVVTS